ncbi:MAG: uroporphyrinogen decarboxylase family protein [Phycisphaerales bacterium]
MKNNTGENQHTKKINNRVTAFKAGKNFNSVMSSRDRVIKAINFDYPDRPPISHAILPATQIKYGAALDEILQTVHEDFGWDMMVDMKRQELPPLYKGGKNYDSFGTLWEVAEEGVCGIPIKYPLSDWNSYPKFIWPELSAGPSKKRLYSGHMAGKASDYYARGGWFIFFEQMQQLRGMENLLMDLALDRPEVYKLRDDLLNFNLRWLDKWLEFPYDGLHFADDWGMQNGPIISPSMWRKIFKPAYKQMFDKVIAAGMDVHFHSDGNIMEFLPDLIELGVKVVNCQLAIMGIDEIKKNYAGKICFRTDLDRQNIMPFGSPTEVRNHIISIFESVGSKKGGIIACGEIGPDIPIENIRAMYDVFMNYRY